MNTSAIGTSSWFSLLVCGITDTAFPSHSKFKDSCVKSFAKRNLSCTLIQDRIVPNKYNRESSLSRATTCPTILHLFVQVYLRVHLYFRHLAEDFYYYSVWLVSKQVGALLKDTWTGLVTFGVQENVSHHLPPDILMLKINLKRLQLTSEQRPKE